MPLMASDLALAQIAFFTISPVSFMPKTCWIASDGRWSHWFLRNIFLPYDFSLCPQVPVTYLLCSIWGLNTFYLYHCGENNVMHVFFNELLMTWRHCSLLRLTPIYPSTHFPTQNKTKWICICWPENCNYINFQGNIIKFALISPGKVKRVIIPGSVIPHARMLFLIFYQGKKHTNVLGEIFNIVCWKTYLLFLGS